MAVINGLGGLQRSNHFVVEIATPPALKSISDARHISLLCNATSLPGIQVGLDDRYLPQGYGVVQPMPWGVIFNDITLRFYADNAGLISNILTKWIDSVVKYNDDTVSNNTFHVNYRKEYATNVVIKVYDERKTSIIEYTLHDAFPAAIQDEALAWDDQNGVSTRSVRLVFTRWTIKNNKVPNHLITSFVDARTGVNKLIRSPTESFGESLKDSLTTMAKNKLTNAGARYIENIQSAIPLIVGRAAGNLRI